jgi:hypothetical protein
MASLSQVGIPGIGFGLLHPKSKIRFLASFLDATGEPLPYSSDLNRQLTRVGGFVQSKLAQFGIHHVEFSDFELEDDLTNTALAAVQKLWDEEKFQIEISYLDGNETVVSKARLKGCGASRITYDDLDYSGGGDTRELEYEIINPRLEGSDVELIKSDLTAAAIYTALKSIKLRKVPTGRSYSLRMQVQFSYEEVEIIV